MCACVVCVCVMLDQKSYHSLLRTQMDASSDKLDTSMSYVYNNQCYPPNTLSPVPMKYLSTTMVKHDQWNFTSGPSLIK